METFDQSLKYLLQHEPADFVRFGLGDPSAEIVEPLESGLPARSRDVDGSYRVARGGAELVVHVEFHRRHQAREELAVDVAEAQIRLFRRERARVLSQVWDLYGDAEEAVLEERSLRYGAAWKEGDAHETEGSQAVYVRVNLRGMGADELLSGGPPALWPLVTLTRDGAREEAVHRARDTIEARTEWTSAERADHLAVLWFVAEAEDVPVRVMKAYISEERLMESTLYKSIFEKGEARGEAKGEANVFVDTIVAMLDRHSTALEAVVQERLRGFDLETLKVWWKVALRLDGAEAAKRLADTIQKAAEA